MFIADRNGHVKKISPSREFITHFGSPGRGDARFAYSGIRGLAVDSQDNIWVADATYHTVQKFDNDGNFLLRIGTATTSAGSGDGQVSQPYGVAVDSADNLYVSEYGNNRLQKFTSNGEFVWKIGGIYTGTADGQFNRPEFVAVNTEDKIYVADSGNKRIQVFNTDGVFQFKFGGTQSGLTCPAHPSLNDIIGMSFGPNGDLYLATFHMWCDNLYQYGADGTYKGLIAITPSPGDALYNL